MNELKLKVRTLQQQNEQAESEIQRLTKSVRIVELEVNHDADALKNEISMERERAEKSELIVNKLTV